jgi:hypothetical protein
MRAAVSISTVKHIPTFEGGGVRGTQRKAVKPVRGVGYDNKLK